MGRGASAYRVAFDDVPIQRRCADGGTVTIPPRHSTVSDLDGHVFLVPSESAQPFYALRSEEQWRRDHGAKPSPTEDWADGFVVAVPAEVVAGHTLLDTREAAERLHVGVRQVREYVRDGRLRARKVGRSYLIDSRDLLRFVDGSPLAGSTAHGSRQRP